METNSVMTYNVGCSEYAGKKVQPWHLWVYINCPWDADIIKRIGRVKKSDGRMLDLQKIEHISLKRISLINDDNYRTTLNTSCPKELVDTFCSERGMSDEEAEIVNLIIYGDTNSVETFEKIIEIIKVLQGYEDKTYITE